MEIYVSNQDRNKIVKLENIEFIKSEKSDYVNITVNDELFATCLKDKANRIYTNIVNMIADCNTMIDLSKLIDD
jgi:hypothetical protein